VPHFRADIASRMTGKARCFSLTIVPAKSRKTYRSRESSH
jgi:hypothetical protein